MRSFQLIVLMPLSHTSSLLLFLTRKTEINSACMSIFAQDGQLEALSVWLKITLRAHISIIHYVSICACLEEDSAISSFAVHELTASTLDWKMPIIALLGAIVYISTSLFKPNDLCGDYLIFLAISVNGPPLSLYCIIWKRIADQLQHSCSRSLSLCYFPFYFSRHEIYI